MKRIKIRARGRADRMKKPFCNIEILLSEKLKRKKWRLKVGQKVNPVGFRLGTSRDHDSVWYAKSKDYSKLVLEDIKVRRRVREILPQAL